MRAASGAAARVKSVLCVKKLSPVQSSTLSSVLPLCLKTLDFFKFYVLKLLSTDTGLCHCFQNVNPRLNKLLWTCNICLSSFDKITDEQCVLSR